jgi:membrane protein implicated in regulation of membrane protease activity
VDADILWLIAGVVLLVVEIFTLSLVLGMLGLAALVTGVAAFAGLGPVLQVVTFAATSAALLVVVRPPVKKALAAGEQGDQNDPRALAGRLAVVVQRVTDGGGQVRLNGELWRARPYAGGSPIEVGEQVTVAAVEGATVLVYATGVSVPELP